MSVNLRGALLCAQAVYPGMRDRGYGKIITVTSVTVETGMAGCLRYVTSKGGSSRSHARWPRSAWMACA